MLHAARSFLFVDMRALLRIALHFEITLLLVAYLKNYFDHVNNLNVQLADYSESTLAEGRLRLYFLAKDASLRMCWMVEHP